MYMNQSSFLIIVYGHNLAWHWKQMTLMSRLSFTGLASFPGTKPEGRRGGCRRWEMAWARGQWKRTCTQNRPRRRYNTCNQHTAPLTANLHHVTVRHVYAPFHGQLSQHNVCKQMSSQREHGGRGCLELLRLWPLPSSKNTVRGFYVPILLDS